MIPSVSDYSNYSTQHHKLLEEYGALIQFKGAVYGQLTMYAMAATARLGTSSRIKTTPRFAPRLT